jgi:RimJ/RimL family protein N-acetyltransferase
MSGLRIEQSQVRFTTMTEEDFAAFLRKSIPEYAYDQMRAGNWTASEAVGKARAEFQQMLPNGPETPNAGLRSVLDETGQKIGMVWYYIDPSRTRKTAFLIDFFIFAEKRGKGYEAAALALFEEEARAQGVERVELQIFAHKDEEIELYRQNAYMDTSIILAKDLGQAGPV